MAFLRIENCLHLWNEGIDFLFDIQIFLQNEFSMIKYVFGVPDFDTFSIEVQLTHAFKAHKLAAFRAKENHF